MCGIAGYVGDIEPGQRREAVARMTAALARRGPDDEGLEEWHLATLGHRRLSIFDLSPTGHQPMRSEKGDVGIVFNGAIYNFKQLRAELEARGHSFQSETDTEVLLNGYLEWGIDRLAEKIDGMFAFAIWDDRSQQLFLVRDRLGVKPLIFSAISKTIAFASTVRSLRSALPTSDLSNEGILEYLEFGFLTDGMSIYSGIEKVRPGEILEWNGGVTSRRTYWQPNLGGPYDQVSFSVACDETERLFLAAVEKRLQADVPVAALLSGGIDSSLVCWAISKLGAEIKAYSVGTPDDQFDESAAARETASLLGIDLTILPLSSDELPRVELLAEAFSEPFACSSALGMLSISELVRANAKVLLTGDGGDDVFLGYREHRHFLLAARLAGITGPLGRRAFHALAKALPYTGSTKRIRSFSSYASGGLRAVSEVRDGLPFYRRNRLFGSRLADAFARSDEAETLPRSGVHLLEDFLEYDLRTRFVGEYLPKVDGATMYHALEARSPFLDVGLWEYATRIAPKDRLQGGTLKAILREIARKRIGPEVANRKKQGFMVPAERWLTSEWRDAFIDSISDGRLAAEGIVDRDAVLSSFRKLPPGSTAPRQFWYLYVLELWLRYEAEHAAK